MYNGYVSSTVNNDQKYLVKLLEEPGCGKVKMSLENDDSGEDFVKFCFNQTVSNFGVDGEFSMFYVLVALYYPGQEVRLSWL